MKVTEWENARAVLAGAGEAASLPPDLALATLEAAVLRRIPAAATGDARS